MNTKHSHSLIASLFLGLAMLASLVSAQNSNVRLRTGDQLELRIAGVPASEIAVVTGTYRIADDGTLNMPYINKVKVAGKSVPQIQSTIQEAYKRSEIYTNPTITIMVQTGARTVTVGGDVKAPQRVPWTADLTLLDAINAAGGFTEFADQGEVKLLRGSQGYEVDIRKIRQDPQQDIKLLPGDKVEVPRSLF